MTSAPPPVRSPILLPDPAATDRLAQWLAPRLGPGDVLLLEGPIGAGKTHFARALIQSLLPAPEDVPSPSYTLVQVYEGPGFAIWHADLYRLGGPDEAIELGLDEAFVGALCLVEWPERLGPERPKSALTLRFSMEAGDSRRIEFLSANRDWKDRLQGLDDV